MINTLLPLDTFIVVNKTVLNNHDRLILTTLYQPIIGSVSVSLYLTLFNFLDKNKIISIGNNHSDLIRNMQLKLEDIKEAFEKLEGIGLLKAYYKKGDPSNYVYELYGPLSANDFINNPILNTALFNNITKKEYKRIVDNYSYPNIDLEGYKDISCSFKDVFNFIECGKLENKNIKKINHLDLKYEPTINLNEILSIISNEILNIKSITKIDMKNIYDYSYIYNLNNDSMKEIIENSLEDRRINMEVLKENCRNYYKFESKGKIPKLVFQNQPLYLRNKADNGTKKARLINQFETVSPYEFLSLKQESQPTKKDMEIIEYLMVEQKLNPGVVNVLIDYVLKINNNKLVKNFVYQIAVQWKRSKIETVNDAIDMALKEHDLKSKKVIKTIKNVEKEPSWINKNIDDNILTDEQLKDLERKLNND